MLGDWVYGFSNLHISDIFDQIGLNFWVLVWNMLGRGWGVGVGMWVGGVWV